MAPEYGPGPLLGTAIALPALAIIAVILRLYVRLRVRSTYLGADDWLVLCSVILVVGHGILQILGVTIGVVGQDDIPMDRRVPARIATSQKIKQAILVMEKVEYTTIKLSVLFLYRRIFGSNITFRRCADALSGLIVLWGVVFLLLEIFVCTADSATSLTCAAQEWTLLWFGITDVLGDIIVLSMPYPCLRSLQMSRPEKIGVTAIFALGTLSTITGIVRLGYVAKFFHAYFHPEFFNNTESAPDLWTTVEVSTGVIAACLPPLGALLRKVPKPRRLFTSMRQNAYGSGGRRSREKGRDYYGAELLEVPPTSPRDRHFSTPLNVSNGSKRDRHFSKPLADVHYSQPLPDLHRESSARSASWWDDEEKKMAS